VCGSRPTIAGWCGCWSPTARDDWAGQAPSFLLSQAWRRPRAAGADTPVPAGRRLERDTAGVGQLTNPARAHAQHPPGLRCVCPMGCRPPPVASSRRAPSDPRLGSTAGVRATSSGAQPGHDPTFSLSGVGRPHALTVIGGGKTRARDGWRARLLQIINCVMRSLPPVAVCRSSGLAIVWLGSGWLVESTHRLSGLSHTASM